MIGRAVAAGLLALAAVVALAGPAFAHVEVQPAQAAAGEPGNFAFRVPNEEDNAATVSLVVHFPVEHPIATVDVPPTTGWTAHVTMRPIPRAKVIGGVSVYQVVDSVSWTDGRIEPGHAQYFNVTTGPLPTDTPSIMFSADQTYSNGDVVKWDQPEPEGAPEPAHPAPVLELTGASVATASPTTGSGDSGAVGTTVSAAPPGAGHSGVSAWVVAAIVAVVAAVAAGAFVLLRRPRSRASHR